MFYRAVLVLFIGSMILFDAFAHGADLPVPHKAKVSVTMIREKGPVPVYVPPAPRAEATKPLDRPAGTP